MNAQVIGSKCFIKTHPVLTYFALTFAISWGGLTVLVGGLGGISAEQITAPFFVLYLATVAGPCTAGALLTGLIYGRTGLRELLSRLFNWRVGARWYAVALLAAPMSLSITLFALSLTSSVFVPGIFATGDNGSSLVFGFSTSQRVPFLLFVLALGLFNGFIEELGWTGFAIPKMRKSYGLLATGLGVGLMWGGWHGLSNYLGSAAESGGLPLAFYISVLLFSFLPPFRVLMVWVYDRTRSLLVAVLMHASLNVFWLASTPLALTGEQRVTWYLAWTAVLWVAVAAVGVATKGGLKRVESVEPAQMTPYPVDRIPQKYGAR